MEALLHRSSPMHALLRHTVLRRGLMLGAASRSRGLASNAPSSSKPDAETVKQLAESARFQEKMWNTFVPERGVRFGDQRFWVLVGIVGALHFYNEYRDAQKGAEPEPDLPPGAARRLPDGRLLMVDGSISAKGLDAAPHHAHTLHKPGEQESKGVINNMKKAVRDAA